MSSTKICIKCKNEKDISCFRWRKDTNKYNNVCIECQKKQKHSSYEKNKKARLLEAKEYRRKNNEKVKISKKNYYENNKDIILIDRKIYYADNKEDIRERQTEYYEENKNIIIKRTQKNNKKYRPVRRKIDPTYRLRGNVSVIIGKSLKNSGGKNGKSVMDYLPYTIEELRQHLEFQFEPWMNWNNHGKYDSKIWNDNDSFTWTWNIDHIIPQSKLPYTSMNDDNFQKCWALSNLQPLKSIDNIKKGNKLR